MTLVEMLVVLAIIGIASTTAALSIGAGRGVHGEAEAKRLEARIQLAADAAMVSDRAIAIVPSSDGYAFDQWDEAALEWRPATMPALAGRHALPGGMVLASAGGPVEDGARPIPLDAGGAVFDLREGGRGWEIGFDGLTASLRPIGPSQ